MCNPPLGGACPLIDYYICVNYMYMYIIPVIVLLSCVLLAKSFLFPFLLSQPEGIGRAGDWKCHLAMVIANNQDKSSVRMLGDSLCMLRVDYTCSCSFNL